MTTTAPKIWTVGKAIAAALNEDTEDQKDLAQRIGKHPTWLSRRISGETRISVADLRLIADAQGRDWNWYGYPYGRAENLEDGYVMGLFGNPDLPLFTDELVLSEVA